MSYIPQDYYIQSKIFCPSRKVNTANKVVFVGHSHKTAVNDVEQPPSAYVRLQKVNLMHSGALGYPRLTSERRNEVRGE